MPHRLAFTIAHGPAPIRSRSHSATRRGRRPDSACSTAAAALDRDAFDPACNNERHKYAERDEGDGSGGGVGVCGAPDSPDPVHHLYLEYHHRSTATASASNSKTGAAAAAAATAAAVGGAEDGLSAACSLLFCCLCRCALRNNEAAVAAHLAGRRHVERARAVPTIRVTISLCTSATGNADAATANAADGDAIPTSNAAGAGGGATRRVQLGLLPALNMPAFWKAVLLALRAEQAAMQRALAANIAAVGGGGAAAALGHHPLLTLRLDEPPSLLHPGIVKLKYVSANGGDERVRDCEHRERGGKPSAPSSPLLRPLLHGSDFALALQSLEELKQIHLVVTDWNSKVAQAASRKKAAANAHKDGSRGATKAGPGASHTAEAPDQSSGARRESGLVPPLLRAPTRMGSSAGSSGRATPSSQQSFSTPLQRPVRLSSLPRGVSISSIESDLAGYGCGGSSSGSRNGGGSSHASTAGSSGSDEDREGALTGAISTPSSEAASDASEAAHPADRSPSPSSQSAPPLAPPRPRCRYFSSDPRFNACNRPRCPFGHFDPPQSADPSQQPLGQGQQRWRPVRKSTPHEAAQTPSAHLLGQDSSGSGNEAEHESPPIASAFAASSSSAPSSASCRPASTSSGSSRQSYSSEQLLALGSSSLVLGSACAHETHARSSSMLIMAQRFGILSPSAMATAAAAANAALSADAGSSTVYWSLSGQHGTAESGRGLSSSRPWLLDMAGGPDGSTCAHQHPQQQQTQPQHRQSEHDLQRAPRLAQEPQQLQSQHHAPPCHPLHPVPGPAPAPGRASIAASATSLRVLPPQRMFVPIEPAAPTVFPRGPEPVLLQPCPLVVVSNGNGNGSSSGRAEFPTLIPSMPQQPQPQPQFPLYAPLMHQHHAYSYQQQHQLHQRYLAEHLYQYEQRHAHAHAHAQAFAHLSQRRYETSGHDMYERQLRQQLMQQHHQQQQQHDSFRLYAHSRRSSVDETQHQHEHQCEFEWETDFEPGAVEAEAEAETEADAEIEVEAEAEADAEAQEAVEGEVELDCTSRSSSRPPSSVGIVWLSNSFDFGFPPLAELLAMRT